MADDIPKMDQGLLIRNPNMTPQEFSDHWYHKHSQLVIPFFLHSGVMHYEQIHGPLTTIKEDPNLLSLPTNKPVLLSSYSGACALPPASHLPPLATTTFPAWKQAYYDEIIKTDERRFLVAEALDHVVRVAPGSVKGERRVVIEEGKALVEVAEEVWGVWREYERRGDREMDEGKKSG